ncbi:MAG: hypothetical protein K2M93_01515 [Muribaculaceae bacterium]|nr:hypothetical protein [Muribaculaceae bacterium]
MKKVYTLAAAVLVSGMAYAQTIQKAPISELSLESKMAVEETNLGNAAKKVNKKATRADEDWKSLGMGEIRNSVLSSLYGEKMFDPFETFPIEIEQNVGDPTQYRIKDMYKEFNYEGLEDAFHFEPGDNYVYINTFVTADGKTVWWIPGEAASNNTGFYADVKIFSSVTANDAGFLQFEWVFNKSLEQVPTQDLYDACPSIFGTVDNGVFTVAAKPGPDAVSSSGTVPEYIFFGRFTNQPAGSGFYANKNGQFCFTLPGVDMPTRPDPFQDYTLIGECDMFNSIMDNLFEEYSAKVAKVEVYEGQKGEFFIKNAWVDGNWNNEEAAALTVFAIDLTDPNFGIIDWQSTNYYDDLEGSVVEYMSKTAGFMWYVTEANQMTKEQLQALQGFDEINVTLNPTTKRINIPAQSIWYSLPDVPKTSQFYGLLFSAEGNPKDSYIQLPANYVVGESAVNEIASEEVNGPTRYFNLQGMEIEAPAKGELVIVKSGSKSSKVIF